MEINVESTFREIKLNRIKKSRNRFRQNIKNEIQVGEKFSK
jgi:hypothetical protein